MNASGFLKVILRSGLAFYLLSSFLITIPAILFEAHLDGAKDSLTTLLIGPTIFGVALFYTLKQLKEKMGLSRRIATLVFVSAVFAIFLFLSLLIFADAGKTKILLYNLTFNLVECALFYLIIDIAETAHSFYLKRYLNS
jgi:NhaP-type Na+/H+ or K+/H+ antiporter